LQDIEEEEMTYADRGKKRIDLRKMKKGKQKKRERDSVKPAVASASIAHKHSN